MSKMTPRVGRRRVYRALPLLAGVALLVSACSSASQTSAGSPASSGGSGSDALSMSSVKSIVASGDPMIELTGLAKGYFTDEGLSISATRTSASSSDVAELVSGSAQFILGGSAAIIAKQAGAPVKVIMAVDKGSDETLDVSKKFAAAHNIPLTSSTPAQVNSQIEALKGSHITIGVTNTTGDGYNYLAAALRSRGLTIGPGKDVNIISTGGAPQLVAAYQTGKLDAFSITPPYTARPDSVQIPLSLVTPDSGSAFFYVLTTDSMISQHPDTVQAFINAMVKSWQFATTNPAQAEAAAAPLYVKYNGTYTPAQIKTVFQQLSKDWSSVVLSSSEFASTLKVVGLAQPTQKLTVTYADMVDNTFVEKALAASGVSASASASSAAS
jgi:ABC-type nitrate/sulfonate/bicarbonate transport system substrate-binding protein